MKALLIRDILYLRSQWRRLLSVPAAWLAAMALLPAHRGLLAAAAALFAALLPLCTLDACPGFERYAALLPVSRSALAVSRHVLGALSSAAALASMCVSALISAHLRRTRVLNTKKKAVPAGTASACRKSLAEFRALWARKGLQSFSAAACTSPKILRVPNECESHSLGEEEQRND